VKRHAIFFAVALALMSSAAVLAAAGRESVRTRPDVRLGLLSMALGDWQGTIDAPTEVLPSDPAATDQISRTYRRGSETIWLSIGLYIDQTEGRRPAARALLFPGTGWTSLSEQRVTISLDGDSHRSLPATLLVKTTRDQRLAVLYWYQVGHRSVASDHWYRALAFWARLVDGKSDGALIRIAWPVAPTVDPMADLAAHRSFVQAFQRNLLVTLAQGEQVPGGGS